MKKEFTIITNILLFLLLVSSVNAYDFSLVTGRATLNCITGDEAAYQNCVARYGTCTRSSSGGVDLICWAEDDNNQPQCRRDSDCSNNQRCSSGNCVAAPQQPQPVQEIIPPQPPPIQQEATVVATPTTEVPGLKLDLNTEEGDKGQVIFRLSEETQDGFTVQKPSLNINLDPKTVGEISKKLDVKTYSYPFYAIIILVLASLITVLFIIKEIVKPGPFVSYKNKKGQVFIIAAIIFSIAIYSVVIPYNTIKEYPGPEDFNELSENYKAEYPKVFNYATYEEGVELGPKLDEFTNVFLGEARKKDPNFGVLYLYKDVTGNVHVVNTLNQKVLNIRLTQIGAEELRITVPSSTTNAGGEICVEGIGTGCTTTNTNQGNFGSGFDNVEDFQNVQQLCFEVPGSIPRQCPDISDFSSHSTVLTQSEIPIATISGRNGVRIEIKCF